MEVQQDKDDERTIGVAFLFPSLARGAYWQPVLAEFTKFFPKCIVFTGVWEGFLPPYQNRFVVKEVGHTRFIRLPIRSKGHYPRGFTLPPILGLVRELKAFAPGVVFSSGFSIWTFIAIILKRIYGWKVIVLYEGSSPSVDRTDSVFHTYWRSTLARRVDAFCTNSRAGKNYLAQFLGIPSEKIFRQPYEVPIPEMRQSTTSGEKKEPTRLIFVTVGQLIERKGLRQLIEAAHVLCSSGLKGKFSLWIVGDGPLRAELERKIEKLNLGDNVRFWGYVPNHQLKDVLNNADVFVFPTLEDVWGVAVLEAMAIGKPVLCSKYAGAAELISKGKDGWIFDPYDPTEIASLMRWFIDNPALISEMGKNAKVKMKDYTPEIAAKFLRDIINWLIVIGSKEKNNNFVVMLLF